VREPDDIRRIAAVLWSFRAQAECEAAARFERIADRLGRTGAAPIVVDMAREAAQDERRHAELCRRTAEVFGGQVTLDFAVTLDELTPAGASPKRRALHEVVAMSCITETLSAALLGEMLAQAKHPVVRSTVHSILRDEIQHSRLGWAHLAGGLSEGDRAWLSQALPGMLADTVTDELYLSPEADDTGQWITGVGGLPRATRRATIEGAVHQVVLPGLEQYGIDTGPARAWLAATATRS
jgi:hypothetical protein